MNEFAHSKQAALNRIYSYRMEGEPHILNNTAITAGSPQTVWTPSSGKKFKLQIVTIANLGTADDVILLDGSTEILRVPVGADEVASIDLGQGKLSSAANNALKVDVVSGTTLTVVAVGIEE